MLILCFVGLSDYTRDQQLIKVGTNVLQNVMLGEEGHIEPRLACEPSKAVHITFPLYAPNLHLLPGSVWNGAQPQQTTVEEGRRKRQGSRPETMYPTYL